MDMYKVSITFLAILLVGLVLMLAAWRRRVGRH